MKDNLYAHACPLPSTLTEYWFAAKPAFLSATQGPLLIVISSSFGYSAWLKLLTSQPACIGAERVLRVYAVPPPDLSRVIERLMALSGIYLRVS